MPTRAMPTRASCSQAALRANSREGNRPKPVSLPARIHLRPAPGRGDTAPRVAGSTTNGGCRYEHLMPHALDAVEQTELRGGVRPFAAHDHCGTWRRPAACRSPTLPTEQHAQSEPKDDQQRWRQCLLISLIPFLTYDQVGQGGGVADRHGCLIGGRKHDGESCSGAGFGVDGDGGVGLGDDSVDDG